jgi:hypothetical protein
MYAVNKMAGGVSMIVQAQMTTWISVIDGPI